jgi:hypothetical protein
VLKVVGKMRAWVTADPQAAIPPVPYEVACVCGTAARGIRQARHQVLTCASCGRKLFVLPFSPLPPVASLPAGSTTPPAARIPKGRGYWRLPLAAAGLTLLVVILTFAVLFRRHVTLTAAARAPESIARHVDAGRKALAQGKFLVAATELEAAHTLRERYPERLSAGERRALTQLSHQARLLADLLPESLEEILRHAADLSDLDDQEWQRVFTSRYRGKAVIFDADVHRDGSGQYYIDYVVFVRDRRAKLDLAKVRLLQDLPLGKTQRLLFGVRLAAMRAEAEGGWSVHFEPESGVLLTDLGAAAACCSQPEQDLREVVERQTDWWTNLP